MKNSNSCGLDGISSNVLKLVKEEVAPAISYLINSSVQNGCFPTIFKTAQVTAIYKNKGSRSDKTNYRPIAGLSTVGKVIETAVNIQMMRYCERRGILGKHQHGFRPGKSTTTALISSLMRWQSAKEKGLYTGCLLFDLSAAYDTLNPKVLARTASYGFDDMSCKWLNSG